MRGTIHDAQVDPEGRRVAVTCSLSDEVVVMDAASLAVVARFPVDRDPGEAGSPRFKPINLAWSPDGEGLWVTMMNADEVRAFAPDGRPAARVVVGETPTQLALTADGATLVVVNRRGGSLSLVDTAAGEEMRRIPLENAPLPHGVALGPEDRVAYVSFEGELDTPGGAVAVRLADGVVLWRREAGSYVLGIAVGGTGLQR